MISAGGVLKSIPTAPAPISSGAPEPEGVARTSALAAPSSEEAGPPAASPPARERQRDSQAPKAGQPLLTICCVCKIVIRDGALPVSHGYCEPCVETALKEIG